MAQTTLEIISHNIPKIPGCKTTFSFKTPWHSEDFPKPLRPHPFKLPLWKDRDFEHYVFSNKKLKQGKVFLHFDIFATSESVNVNHEVVGSGEFNLFSYMMDLDSIQFQDTICKHVNIHGTSAGNNNVIGQITIRISIVLWPATFKFWEANRNWLLQQVEEHKRSQGSSEEAEKENCNPGERVKRKVKRQVTFSF